MTAPALIEFDERQFADQGWRLSNLYMVANKRGRLVRFIPNEAQMRLLHELHTRNVILKARQFGFTTLMCIYGLDCVIWKANFQAGIIAHNLDDAEKIFRTKIRVPYNNLPEALRTMSPAKQARSKEFIFEHREHGEVTESAISVSTSYRSGTLQLLHVSEFGKIAVKYPEKAREIMTGALEAVPQNGTAVFESTAEGNAGRFYDMCEEAQNLQKEDRPLTPLEFKFHFQPWWDSKEYRFSPAVSETFVFRDYELKYFEKLEEEHGIVLDIGQRAWYAAKQRQLGDDMLREYPSTPEEAFQVAIEGAYYAKEMAAIRKEGRILPIPIATKLPVHTFWDLGRNDVNAIWFMQHIGGVYRFVDYYENSGESLEHYAKVLKKKPYIYGVHYLPHDAEVTDITRSDNLTREQVLNSLQIKPTDVVDRVQDIGEGIEMTRQSLAECWFDSTRCATGIKALDNYRKEWDEKLGTFKQRPHHDWASNGADAFRQFAQGYKAKKAAKKQTKRGNWRTR